MAVVLECVCVFFLSSQQEYLDILAADTSRKEVESLSTDSGCSVIESNEVQKPSDKDASV